MPEIINPRQRYNAAALEAIRIFRAEKPWQGTEEERAAKLTRLHEAMTAAYGLTTRLLILPEATEPVAGFNAEADAIVIGGNLSVVSYFYCFAAARGLVRFDAHRWSVTLFAKMFPKSFARCEVVQDGQYVVVVKRD